MKGLRGEAETKGLEEGIPKGQEALESCPSWKSMQTRKKERKRGRESLSCILWTFYPSFHNIVINKYDAYAFYLESTTKQERHAA